MAADTAACAAVSGAALNTNTACDAVMLDVDGVTSACTYTSVTADATACAAVDLSLATARSLCDAINTNADATLSACHYTPAAFSSTTTCAGDWSAGDVAATGCTNVIPGFYDHDKLSYTAPLQCGPGNMAGECIQAECRNSGGGLVLNAAGAHLSETECSANSGTNSFNPNAITLCVNTAYYSATTCTPVPPGTFDDDQSSITDPILCLAGSTTDTLDQPGAATCTAIPTGFYDDDAIIDGAPFCSDSGGNFIPDSGDVAATRPTEIYCEVSASGGIVTIVNPTVSDVTVGEVRLASAAGLDNPTGAFTGPYAQQALQTPAFP